MINTYIYEANAIVLTYDITNHASFEDLEDWLGIVHKTFSGKDLPLMALMGNKIDLNHMQAVKPEEHTKFAEDNGLYNFYVSAKTGDQVTACFYKIAADLSGVKVTKNDIEIQQKVAWAEIIEHQQDKPLFPEEDETPQEKLEKAGKKKKCQIF